MEHILGCHGEWLIAAQALAALPFAGVFLRALFPVLGFRVPTRTHKESQ